MKSYIGLYRPVYRPADRTGEDLDMIYTHLKDLKAFEKFHPLLLQQICYYSFYEDLEQGVIRTYVLSVLLGSTLDQAL